MQTLTSSGEHVSAASIVRQRLDEARVKVVKIETREFPEETIFVVHAQPPITRAVQKANEIDRELAAIGFKGFVTIREVDPTKRAVTGRLRRGVIDGRANDLIALITARSRTSEAQPSLEYIKDAAENFFAHFCPGLYQTIRLLRSLSLPAEPGKRHLFYQHT